MKVKQFVKNELKIIFLFCLAISLYLAFFNLGKAPLENWDEAWYGEVTKQMLLTRDFIVLQWNHTIWLDKPPIYMWLSAFFSTVFGLSEFSLRLTSALSGVAILLLVFLYCYRQFGIISAVIGFLTLALNNIFVWRMRSGNIDTFVTLLILLTYFLQISRTQYKYPLLGLLFALIFLTKASLVLLPISIFIAHEVIFERRNMIKRLGEYVKLFFIAMSLPVLWLSLGSLKVGIEFMQYFIMRSDQGVAAIGFTKFNLDYISYAYYSLQRRFFFVLAIGVIFALKYIKDAKIFLLLAYGGALLLQLSFTEKSNNWYLTPSMPFWSILIAFGVFHTMKLFKNNIFISIFIIGVCGVLFYRTLMINILPILESASAVRQMQSSKELKRLTKENDVIVRLDHLYPTTIYYSDRKILASPEGTTETKTFWISRSDLLAALDKKEIRWLVGVNKDVKVIQKEASTVRFKEIKVNEEETILQVL